MGSSIAIARRWFCLTLLFFFSLNTGNILFLNPPVVSVHNYQSLAHLNFCSVIYGYCSILVNIRNQISLSLAAVSPCTKIKHLNMSTGKLSDLNNLHCECMLPTYVRTSFFSCFTMFKHLNLVWKTVSFIKGSR